MHASGHPLFIESMAVDSGYHTQNVYNYCRLRPIKCMATKGFAVAAKPIVNRPSMVDVTYAGETIKEGCQLWMLGSDTAKAQIYSRLAMPKPGPGYYHFPVGIDDEYYLQLTAEKRLTQYVNGFPKLVWVKLRDRNDALDCEGLALAAAIRAGMPYCDWAAVRKAKLGDGNLSERSEKQRKPKEKLKKW